MESGQFHFEFLGVCIFHSKIMYSLWIQKSKKYSNTTSTATYHTPNMTTTTIVEFGC